MVKCEKGRTSWASLETVLYPPLQVAAVLPVRIEYAYIDALTLYNDLLCISLDEDPHTLEALDLQTGDTLWTFKAPETGGSSGSCASMLALPSWVTSTGAINDAPLVQACMHGLGQR